MNTETRILELLRIAGPTGATSAEIVGICHAWTGAVSKTLEKFEKDRTIVSEYDAGPYAGKRRYWLASKRYA